MTRNDLRDEFNNNLDKENEEEFVLNERRHVCPECDSPYGSLDYVKHLEDKLLNIYNTIMDDGK